jgi:hypothetical protein
MLKSQPKVRKKETTSMIHRVVMNRYKRSRGGHESVNEGEIMSENRDGVGDNAGLSIQGLCPTDEAICERLH